MARNRINLDTSDPTLMMGSFVDEANALIDKTNRIGGLVSNLKSVVECHAIILKNAHVIQRVEVIMPRGIRDIHIPPSNEIARSILESLKHDAMRIFEQIRREAKELSEE